MLRSRPLSPATTPDPVSPPARGREALLPGSARRAAALFAVLALGSAAVSASRSATLELDRYPELSDRRQLRMWAADARYSAQRIGGAERERQMARADSIADRFHALAARVADDAGRSADDHFTEWYLGARGAALGISLGDDASGSGAELAAVAYRRLDDRLAADVAAASRAVQRDVAIAQILRTAAWSFAGLALVSLGYGLAVSFGSRARRPRPQPEIRVAAPASPSRPALTAWTQPVRAATPAAASSAVVHGDPTGPAAAETLAPAAAPTPGPARRPVAPRYVPGWGAASSLVPVPAAGARPVALYDALHVLERVLRDTSEGMKRAEAPLALARDNTRSTAQAASQLAVTAAALAVQATQLQAILGSFRVTRVVA